MAWYGVSFNFLLDCCFWGETLAWKFSRENRKKGSEHLNLAVRVVIVIFSGQERTVIHLIEWSIDLSFDRAYKCAMMCQSNTTNLYYVYFVLGQHVSILIESSSGPSKKIDPYLEMLECAVGSQTLTFLIKLCIKCTCRCVLNVQSGYLFLKF